MDGSEPRDPEDYDPHYSDETEPRDADGSDELEADIMQANHPFGTGLFGTTEREALAGEGLDRALAQERPDEPSTEDVVEVVAEEPLDDEDELVGEAVTTQDQFGSPEEAALSVRDDAPGATDHDDPHPVDEG